jgi:hypothetical protein
MCRGQRSTLGVSYCSPPPLFKKKSLTEPGAFRLARLVDQQPPPPPPATTGKAQHTLNPQNRLSVQALSDVYFTKTASYLGRVWVEVRTVIMQKLREADTSQENL